MAKLTHEDAIQDEEYYTPTVIGSDEADEINTSKSKSSYQIKGNDGDDVIYSYFDTVYGGNGDDTILEAPSVSSKAYNNYGYGYINGDAGDDQITVNNESYSGQIYGGAGDDTVNILLGSATVYGETGNDLVMGGFGRDVVYGGAGQDFLQGAGGADEIYGGSDDDTLYGNNGNDTLHGNEDDDYLSGEGGRDKLYGGNGDDVLNGGLHNDTIDGGSGTDTAIINAATSNVIGYENLNGVITIVSSDGVDKIQNVENFQFNNKTITLDELEITLGHLGIQRGVIVNESYNNTLETLSGTNGNDEINLSYNWYVSSIAINAKAGNDIIFTNDERSVVADGGDGHDTLVTNYLSDVVGAFVKTDNALTIFTSGNTLKLSNIEEIEFTDFVFTIDHFQSFFADFELSADTILGSHTNDTLGGTLLDDKFYSGTGQDSIDGNEGDDTLIFNFDSSQVTRFTSQNNQVTIRIKDSNYSVSNIEHFQFSDKTIDLDHLTDAFSRVNTADQTFNGTDANDDLKGGLGNDRLNGVAGDDTLYGDAGKDVIDGGDGIDTVVFDQFIQDVSSYTNNNGTVTLNLNNSYGYYYDNQDIITNVEYFEFFDKTVAFEELDEVFLRVNTADQTFIADDENRDISGGNGYDTVVFDFAIADIKTYSSTYYTSKTVVFNGETYSLESIESYQFSDRTVKAADLNKQLSSVRTDDQYLDGSYNASNVISGGLGNDRITTYDGDDTISGGGGDDFINAGSGNDKVDGGDGDDTIRLNQNDYWNFPDSQSSGNNVVDAGNGNDLIYLYDNPGVNNIDGGEGDDTVEFDYKSSEITQVKIVDNRATFRTQNTTNTFSNVEKFKFGILTVSYTELDTYFSDVFVDASLSNIINGTSDDDTINGSEGNDTINPGTGIDIINAGAGDDLIIGAEIGETIDGGAGTDTIKFGFAESTITSAVRKLDGSVELTTTNGTTTLSNVETVVFVSETSHAVEDIVTAQNTGKSVFTVPDGNGGTFEVTPTPDEDNPQIDYYLVGDADGNNVIGSSSNDFMNLAGGNDAANGGDGNDVLDGGTGSNFLTGGVGDDIFYLDGRGVEIDPTTISWSTITDFESDSILILLGYEEGTSLIFSQADNFGAKGYEGASIFYDLDNNGSLDTGVTFTGLTLDQLQLPSSGVFEGALVFIGA